MRLQAQGVEYQYLSAFYLGLRFGADVAGIGNIGKIADTETQNWQIAMRNRNWYDVGGANSERLAMFDGMQAEVWPARVFKLRVEGIKKATP